MSSSSGLALRRHSQLLLQLLQSDAAEAEIDQAVVDRQGLIREFAEACSQGECFDHITVKELQQTDSEIIHLVRKRCSEMRTELAKLQQCRSARISYHQDTDIRTRFVDAAA